MSRAVGLWLRRSSGPLVAPALVAVAVVAVLSRSGWHWEWNRAMSWASSATILLGPLVAGMVAFDLVRRAPSSFTALLTTTRRGPSVVGTVTVAHWLYAVVAWLVALGLAAGRTAATGAPGPPDAWIFVEAPVALLASASFGALVASLIRNVAAAPLAAVGAYLVPVVSMPLGLSGLMSAGGSTASTFDIEPDPAVASLLLATNALVALTCWVVARRRLVPSWGHGGRALLAPVVLAPAVLLLGALVAVAAVDPRLSYWRPTADGPPVCIGTTVRTCGPGAATPLLRLAAADLGAAQDRLRAHGIELPATVTLSSTGEVPEGSGVLTLTPETIQGGHLDRWDVALTVATPTACPAYRAELPPADLLNGQSELASWVHGVLGGADGAADAPLARQTFQALRACDGAAVPTWPLE